MAKMKRVSMWLVRLKSAVMTFLSLLGSAIIKKKKIDQ